MTAADIATAATLTAAVRRAGVHRCTVMLTGSIVHASLYLRDVEGAPCAVTGEAESIEDAIAAALRKVTS